MDKYYRIKILSKNGYDLANQQIMYRYKDNIEDIKNLRAQTINTDSYDISRITKIEKNQFYVTEEDANYKQISFTFPAVQVGSIIEYKFTVEFRNFRYLDAWVFQSKIPTIYSLFESDISLNRFRYSVVYTGKNIINKYQNKTISKWELENIEAIQDEDFVFCLYDNLEAIQFQLIEFMSIVSYSEYRFYEFVPSWKNFTKKMLSVPLIKKYLKRPKRSLLTKINNKLISNSSSNTEKITKIYDYVSQNYKWNNRYTKYPTKNISNLIIDKRGNSAEINLLLIALLKNAGFEAYPMLISTKSHGKVVKEIPLSIGFNHILCAVKIGKNYTLL